MPGDSPPRSLRPGLGARPGPRGRDPSDFDPRNLYVGYIAAHVTDEMLEALFRSCGEVVECTIVRERHTGESKGFGFVRMATEAGAQAALERLNNHLIGNKRLAVRPKGRPGPRSGGVVGAPWVPGHGDGAPVGPMGPADVPTAPGAGAYPPPPPSDDADGMPAPPLPHGYLPPDVNGYPQPPPGSYPGGYGIPPYPGPPGADGSTAADAEELPPGVELEIDDGGNPPGVADDQQLTPPGEGGSQPAQPNGLAPLADTSNSTLGAASTAAAAAAPGVDVNGSMPYPPSSTAADAQFHTHLPYGGYMDPYYGHVPMPSGPLSMHAVPGGDEPGVPGEEPAPPGEDESATAAAGMNGADAAAAGQYGYGYPYGYSYPGYGADYQEVYADPSMYMSAGEYEAYMNDSYTVPPDAAATAASDQQQEAAVADDKEHKQAAIKPEKKPTVVQVLALDAQEVERWV